MELVATIPLRHTAFGRTFKSFIISGGVHILILTTILLLTLWPFHHHKDKPVPSSEDKAFSIRVESDMKILKDGLEGAKAFEEDTQYSKFERPELDAFEHQLFICSKEIDDHQFDKDIDVLIDLGNKLMSLDEQLHKENVI